MTTTMKKQTSLARSIDSHGLCPQRDDSGLCCATETELVCSSSSRVRLCRWFAISFFSLFEVTKSKKNVVAGACFDYVNVVVVVKSFCYSLYISLILSQSGNVSSEYLRSENIRRDFKNVVYAHLTDGFE